ncbi:hypothetical protein AMATHDRAFT_143407 [Amanita thiersii Skay4041]|uniref:Uncharacterized protein n=1 Tax=Amanita thiersii Skay4041 TaxID=703135 RepID=A0A2A9NTR8_9AGAR|nr:hypothetical protein AMATHDRAFT_143407 [Amanita thiersii Skay4041]
MKVPDTDETSKLLFLYKGNLIPLRVVLGALTWVLHDYCMYYISQPTKHSFKPQRWNVGKVLYFWIRYYTIVLLILDATRIHVFSHGGVVSETLCVVIAPFQRFVGAISLWTVEIIIQLRIYALFRCSRGVAVFNGLAFIASIAAFFWILIHNTLQRRELIRGAMHFPLPGCPTINTGLQAVQWLPATLYEVLLFWYALFKTIRGSPRVAAYGQRKPLSKVLLKDNMLYFFGVTCVLCFNNVMVAGKTRIPWFGFGPFHAALGIMTSRMMIRVLKTMAGDDVDDRLVVASLNWAQSEPRDDGVIIIGLFSL